MKIREIIAILNRMRGDGIVSRYAIGGAVAATFHLEPIATLDVDVFVPVTRQPGRQIAMLTPIYEYLKARGATMEGEYIVPRTRRASFSSSSRVSLTLLASRALFAGTV